jgi:hypothetical protein
MIPPLNNYITWVSGKDKSFFDKKYIPFIRIFYDFIDPEVLKIRF